MRPWNENLHGWFTKKMLPGEAHKEAREARPGRGESQGRVQSAGVASTWSQEELWSISYISHCPGQQQGCWMLIFPGLMKYGKGHSRRTHVSWPFQLPTSMNKMSSSGPTAVPAIESESAPKPQKGDLRAPIWDTNLLCYNFHINLCLNKFCCLKKVWYHWTRGSLESFVFCFCLPSSSESLSFFNTELQTTYHMVWGLGAKLSH